MINDENINRWNEKSPLSLSDRRINSAVTALFISLGIAIVVCSIHFSNHLSKNYKLIRYSGNYDVLTPLIVNFMHLSGQLLALFGCLVGSTIFITTTVEYHYSDRRKYDNQSEAEALCTQLKKEPLASIVPMHSQLERYGFISPEMAYQLKDFHMQEKSLQSRKALARESKINDDLLSKVTASQEESLQQTKVSLKEALISELPFAKA